MDRIKKIERILDLQGKIHQLAEWRLGMLDRRQGELSDKRLQLFETLNGDAPLHGLFVDAMAKRLATLAREADRVGRARDAQQRRLLEEGLRLKRFERVNRKAHHENLEQERKRGFQAILDILGNVDDASLP